MVGPSVGGQGDNMEATPAAVSFTKSLFHGNIVEELIFPFPLPRPSDHEAVRLIMESLHKLAAEHIDAAAIDAEAKIPAPVLDAMKQMGLFGMIIPEGYGGIGLSATAYTRVMQELSGLESSLPVTIGAHQSIGLKGLLLAGNEEQKRRYLPRLASGEMIAAFALTEPSAGSDAQSIKMRAVRQADESWLLNGTKIWITNGGLADFFTVFAQTDVELDGERKDRITAFIVERAHGVRSGPEEHKLGIRGSSTTALYFEDVRVPPQNVLGEPGKGFKVAMQILNSGRLGLAAGSLGAAKTLIKLAVEHARGRRAFGRAISEFGLIQHKIARMITESYALESMVYLTTGMIDAGAKDYAVESAICKVFGAEALWRIVNEALQIAAGAGYMKEYPYERLLRDARINLIFEGTNEILRLFIALSGMEGPGAYLAEVAGAIRAPLKQYGLIADYVVNKIRQSVYGDAITHAHPLLKREAVLVEDFVGEGAKAVEKVLRRHGKAIVERQFACARIADLMIDLYSMAAVISRTSAAIENRGEEGAKRDLLCARVYCEWAWSRMKGILRAMDTNTDEMEKEIAKLTVDDGGYGTGLW
jgi:acyl-CoA dehydrogenase family protein 9